MTTSRLLITIGISTSSVSYTHLTNWSFLRAGEVYPGYPNYRELQYGHADGNQWVAAECDAVSYTHLWVLVRLQKIILISI